MFIAVYCNHKLPNDLEREDIEDLILDCFEQGKVTGGGGGLGGCNVDLEIKDPVSAEEALRRIREALRSVHVDGHTEIQIEDRLFPLDTD
jgi:hypothetical protein